MHVNRSVSAVVSFTLAVSFFAPVGAAVLPKSAASVAVSKAGTGTGSGSGTKTPSIAISGVANELGRIPILEYHQVGPKESRWTRSFDHFRDDLTWLYNNDYRAISLNDFLDQKISVEHGKKPVVFTFDDGGYTQLNFKEGKVDPYTAIGVMDDFLKVHPDFGSSAMFYLNANPFPLVKDKKKALDYLLSTGRQIGNHTIGHANLAKTDANGVTKELAAVDKYIRGLGFSDVRLDTLAYPFGGVPKGAAFEAQKKYVKLGLLVGAEPAVLPYAMKYDAYRVPRIQAIDDEWKRWFKRGAGETGKSSIRPIFVPFVSDGDPDKVTVLSENGLVRGMLRKGVTVQIGNANAATVPAPKVKSTTLDIIRDGQKNATKSSVEDIADQEMSVQLEPKIVVPKPVVAPVVKVVKKVKPTEKPVENMKPIEPYPYLACNDPEAVSYIQYKKTGVVAAPIAAGSTLPWAQVGMFPGTAVRWVRETTHPNAVRGIYFTGSTASSEMGKKLADRLVAAGGNAVVFDINEDGGALTYGKPDQKPLLKDMRAFVQDMNSRGVYTIARIVVFKDKIITRVRPDMAIQSSGGGMWRDNKGAVWLDPSNPATVQYAIDMAKEAAAMGVDEVQFDYVRFPTEGNLEAARYKFSPSKKQKWEVIRDFMREARKQTIATGVKLGADIFGIVGWQKGYDAKSTGQKIECIAPYLDTIYPMGYPSHFGPGFAGHANPADEPYFFTWRTAQYFTDYARGTGVAIRPWLQAFRYRVTIPYNGDYIYQQMKGAFDASSDGFVLWNAGNGYDTAWGVIGK